jgi:peptidoglycan/xylan/chitin deacetylase (PgdA/CDA1 family)
MSRFGQIARGLGRFIPADAVRSLGRPAAVFFHGVEREMRDARLQHNHHEAEDFRAIARTLKRDFDVLPLAALSDVLKAPDRHPRALFLMSDDGYANTLSVAADILEEARLPWTLFASTHHVATGERNPIFLARLFCFEAPSGVYDIPHLPKPFILGDARDAVADRTVWQLRTLDMVRAQQAVDAMMAAFDAAPLLEAFASEAFLDWEDLRALKVRGVEIGAHAHRHWPMHDAQAPSMLREQAATSKALIEAQVGRCRYFSYPFGNKGDISRGAWHSVRDAGYDYAFTTLAGTLDAQANPFLLPRFELTAQGDHLTALISLLRAGNRRVESWQRALAG